MTQGSQKHREFSQRSSAHGVGYLFETNQSMLHYIYWFVVCNACLAACVHLCCESIASSAEDPVLTTIDSLTWPIEKAPYPTVTICPPPTMGGEEYDSWNFIRAAYNQFAFTCFSEEECQRTQMIRDDFRDFLVAAARHILKRTPMVENNWMRLMHARYLRNKTAETGNATEVHRAAKTFIFDMMTGINDHRLHDYLFIGRDKQPGQRESIIEGIAAFSDFGYCLDDVRSIYEHFRTCVVEESHSENEFTDCMDLEKLSDHLTRKEHLVACGEQSSNATLLAVEYCNMLHMRLLDPNACISESDPDAKERLEIADDMTKAMEYPVKSGLGDLIVQLATYYEPNLSRREAQQELLHKLSPRAIELSDECKRLYPLYGRGGENRTFSSSSMDGTSKLGLLINCRYFYVSRNPSPAIGILRDALKESRYALRDLQTITEEEKSQMYCDLDPNSDMRCSFKPVPTDTGLCMAFNAEAIGRNFADSEYADAFYAATNLSEESYRVIYNKPDLTQNIMSVALFKSQWSRVDSLPRTRSQDIFAVDVNAKNDYFDVSSNGGVDAKVGYETTVTITPRVIYSAQSMETLTIQQRECCTESEFDGCTSSPDDDYGGMDRVFNNFTNKACGFENRFHYAMEKHRCVPWFLPKGERIDGDIDFCSRGESTLFQESMDHFRLDSTSPSCYENCEEVIYDYIVTSNPIKAGDWCADDITALTGLGMDSEWRKKEEGRIQWRFATKKQYCAHMFSSDLALLTIEISSPKLQRMVRRRRVTTSDLIGTLGGTFGAFGGLSFITFMEFLYWAVVIVGSGIREKFKLNKVGTVKAPL